MIDRLQWHPFSQFPGKTREGTYLIKLAVAWQGSFFALARVNKIANGYMMLINGMFWWDFDHEKHQPEFYAELE